MSFGKRLKESRMLKKLTQVEVAKKLGIDDTTISKYENDKSEPDNETLTKLLDLYEVNFDYVHGKETNASYKEETKLDSYAKRMAELVRTAKSEEQAKKMVDLAEEYFKDK